MKKRDILGKDDVSVSPRTQRQGNGRGAEGAEKLSRRTIKAKGVSQRVRDGRGCRGRGRGEVRRDFQLQARAGSPVARGSEDGVGEEGMRHVEG